MLQVGLGGSFPNSQYLSSFLDAEPWGHGKQHAQLARGQTIELRKGFTREWWHYHRVLHEDRCRRGKSAPHIPALPAFPRKAGGDKTRLLGLRKSKRETAVRHFGFIHTGIIDGFGKCSSRSAVNRAKAVVLDPQCIAGLNLVLSHAVHEDHAGVAIRQINSRAKRI